MSPRGLRADAGFTMIEVLVAATLLVIGAFATLALLDNGARATSTSKERDVANAVAQEVVERASGGRYTGVTATTAARNDMTDVDAAADASVRGPADRLQLAMGDNPTTVTPTTATVAPDTPVVPPTQAWNLTRNGTTFRVSYAACTISDVVSGVEIKGPYDCNPTQSNGGGGKIPEGSATVGLCTAATVPTAGTPSGTTGSSSSTTTAGSLASLVLRIGAAPGQSLINLGACLGLNSILPLQSTLCALSGPSGSLTGPLSGLVGEGGLLGGLARLSAGSGTCASQVETTPRGAEDGIGAATRITVSVSWTARNGTARTIDRRTLVRRPAA